MTSGSKNDEVDRQMVVINEVLQFFLLFASSRTSPVRRRLHHYSWCSCNLKIAMPIFFLDGDSCFNPSFLLRRFTVIVVLAVVDRCAPNATSSNCATSGQHLCGGVRAGIFGAVVQVVKINFFRLYTKVWCEFVLRIPLTKSTKIYVQFVSARW